MPEVIHVRQVGPGRPAAPSSKRLALSLMPTPKTLCGAVPTTYDILRSDIKATLASPIWRDRLCLECLRNNA